MKTIGPPSCAKKCKKIKGHLIYCTCQIEKHEVNGEQLKMLLENFLDKQCNLIWKVMSNVAMSSNQMLQTSLKFPNEFVIFFCVGILPTHQMHWCCLHIICQ